MIEAIGFAFLTLLMFGAVVFVAVGTIALICMSIDVLIMLVKGEL